MYIGFLCKVDYSVNTAKGDLFMKKAGRRGIHGIKEDTLIVTIDIGLEMNRGYCTTPDGRDTRPFRFDTTQKGSPPSIRLQHSENIAPVFSIR